MVALSDIDPESVALDRATEADMAEIAGLSVQLAAAGGRTVDPAEAGRRLARVLGAGHSAILFRTGGRALGLVLWADFGDHLFVRQFVIDAAQRRHGLGAALFARFRREVAGDTPVRVEVTNAAAQRFWEAQGLTAWSTGLRSDRLKETA